VCFRNTVQNGSVLNPATLVLLRDRHFYDGSLVSNSVREWSLLGPKHALHRTALCTRIAL
ncbi:MAG TPA: hypothetical protein VHR84_16245, partial [Terriglobales bacterium]|nr:hypothetical protein [Terriglobales bacterium]